MIGQTIRGRYEVTAVLGKGAMGTVYRATDVEAGREVSVKVLGDELGPGTEGLARFRHEVEALQRLDHPNIVGFVEAFEDQGRYVIVMEYVSGGNLLDLIKTGRLPISRARQIALDLADALIRAHRMGIIHRDIKPENILLTEEGTPKLADFGVARLAEGTRLTGSGIQVGTPYYMAPEAWEGKSLDAQADIWSLGVVLYEMLSGEAPFGGETAAVVMHKVLATRPPDLRRLRAELPAGLVAVVGQMLTRDRRRRYASMRQVAFDLERGQTASIRPGARDPRGWLGPDIPKWALWTAGGTMFLAVTAGWGVFFQERVSGLGASATPVSTQSQPLTGAILATTQVSATQAVAEAGIGLTTSPSPSAQPTVDPTPGRLVGKFLYTVDGVINIASEDGSISKALPTEGLYVAGATWMQDGSRILFFGQPPPGPRTDGHGDIYVIDEDGSNLRQVTNTVTWSKGTPSISPDGDFIMYAGGNGVEVMRVDGSEVQKVVPDLDAGFSWVVTANWSPDGSQIVYLRISPACNNCTQTIRLIVVNRDGSNPVVVHTTKPKNGTTLLVSSPSWSPDGTRIGFLDLGAAYTVALDGSDVPTPTSEWVAKWLPSYWPQWGKYEGCGSIETPSGNQSLICHGVSTAPSTWYVPPGLILYKFCVEGWPEPLAWGPGWERSGIIEISPQASIDGSGGPVGNCFYLMLNPETPSGTYTVTVNMPNGERPVSSFAHYQ